MEVRADGDGLTCGAGGARASEELGQALEELERASEELRQASEELGHRRTGRAECDGGELDRLNQRMDIYMGRYPCRFKLLNWQEKGYPCQFTKQNQQE